MKNVKKSVPYILLIIGLFFVLTPIYFVIISPFKSNMQISENFFGFPTELYLGSLIEVLTKQNFFGYISNSFLITTLSLLGCYIILPMTAYPLARMMDTNKFYKILYFFLILGIFVPFQVKMLPLIKMLSIMGMMNKEGLIIVYIASSICEGVFLYVGYIVSLPKTLEEAAYIDGASTIKTYTAIILPLLKPMTATVLIRNALWIWNDFTLPLLVLNRDPSDWTLVLFQYNFKSQFGIDYSLIFASLLISIIPIMITYLVLQKFIMGGLTSGAIKE